MVNKVDGEENIATYYIPTWEDDPEKRHIGICRMGNKIGLFDVGWHWQDITYYKVTHWMLLPDLPTD